MPQIALPAQVSGPRLALPARLGGCALAVAMGVFVAGLLLMLAGGGPAWAATTVIEVDPGESIQAAIDGAPAGETILINAGTYTESLTLNKAVSLTGVSSATVILRALTDQRVLTVTGASVNSSVVISGLTFTGGSEMAPFGSGGGMLLTAGAQPRLESIRVISNQASFIGGGIYGQAVRLVNSVVQSNTAGLLGGGVTSLLEAGISGSRFEANTCTLDGCMGGGLYSAGPLLLTDTLFLNNVSRLHGGGALAALTSTVTGARFAGNHCTEQSCRGGGLAVSNTVTLSNAEFISNVSVFMGGGLFANTAQIANSLFQSNQCLDLGCLGGGLWSLYDLTLTATQFLTNESLGPGAGLGSDFGSIQITAGKIQSNSCNAGSPCGGGGLDVYGDLTLSGTTVLSNVSGSNGAGAQVGGATNITNASFQGNTSYSSGGGLWTQSDVSISGTRFLNNSTLIAGGGLATNGSAFLTNTEFISNTTMGGDGGGALVGQAVALTGVLFEGNQSLESGGGLIAVGDGVLSATRFLSNTAVISGGGLAIGSLVSIDSLFQGNQCAAVGCYGGGVHVSSLTAMDTDFIGNSAWADGGGALVINSVVLSGGVFEDNLCLHDDCIGGGLSIGGTLALTGTEFSSNTARLGGGAIHVAGAVTINTGLLAGNQCTQAGCDGGGLSAGGSLVITATHFVGNRAVDQGGGLIHQAGDGSIVNALFARNSAGTAGAALYLASSGTVDVLHTTIASPTLGAGAAVDVVSGTVQIINSAVASYSVGIRRVSAGSVFEDYNLFFGVPAETVGVMTGGGNDVTADPRFAAAAADNYRLTHGSAAANAGADFGIATDFEDDPRPQGGAFDIGYDEYLNLAPTAGANSYSTAADQPLLVPEPGVLDNDTDPNLDSLTAVLVSGPATGTLSLLPTGGFVYTPTLAYAGPVTFTYQATDGELNSPTATVTITVAAAPGWKLYLPLVSK